jgi:hypothetical protein
VTQFELKTLDAEMTGVRAADHATEQIEGLNERHTAVVAPSRDMRYFVKHRGTAQLNAGFGRA